MTDNVTQDDGPRTRQECHIAELEAEVARLRALVKLYADGNQYDALRLSRELGLEE